VFSPCFTWGNRRNADNFTGGGMGLAVVENTLLASVCAMSEMRRYGIHAFLIFFSPRSRGGDVR